MINQRVWDQIVVDRQDRTAPFQQIANAIRHKIATNQLEANTSLPSVRSLADQLGVTPTTVARAYRHLKSEGLVKSLLGLGTVVSDTRHLVFEARQRSTEELDRAIDQALSPLLLRGYAPSAIYDAIERRLALATSTRQAVVVSDARIVMEKYTEIMRRELTPLGITVKGLLLNQLRHPTAAEQLLLQESSRVITALGLRRPVREALDNLKLGTPISIILTELKLSTLEQIVAIPKDASTLIVTEERYRNSVLGLLHEYLPHENLSIARNFGNDEFRKALACNQVVVHSLGMSELVRSTATDQHTTILMDYQVRQDAMAKLRESFMAEAPALTT